MERDRRKSVVPARGSSIDGGEIAASVGVGALVVGSPAESSVFGVDVSGSAAPQFLPEIVLAGPLYPLVFATAGAVLTTVARTR